MEIKVPSGVYGEKELNLLRMLHESRSIRWDDKPFTFKSGILSHVYVDIRDDFTQEPFLMRAVGEYIRDKVREMFPAGTRTPCLIGVPTAGTPLAHAGAQASADRIGEGRVLIGYRQMRPERKVAHGASHGWTNKPPEDRHEYLTIEQVTSTGGSLWDHIARLKEDGYPVERMRHLIFVDWELGSHKFLAARGIRNVVSLFKMSDVAYAYRGMGLWGDKIFQEVSRIMSEHAAHK